MPPRVFAFLLVSAALASAPLVARAAPPRADHALGFGLGYAHYAILDEAATSLAYDAHLATGTLGYVGESTRLRWGLRLGTAFGHEEATSHPGRAIRFVEEGFDGSREETVVPMRGPVHMPSAALTLERRIALGAVSLFVGGAARFDMTYAQGFATPGLLQLASLRPSVAIRYRWRPRHALELGVGTTVLGFMTRMPYHQTVSQPNATPYGGLVRQGSRVRTVNRLQTLDVEASYALHFGAHGALRAALGLDFLHDDDPRPLRTLSSRAAISVLYRF